MSKVGVFTELEKQTLIQMMGDSQVQAEVLKTVKGDPEIQQVINEAPPGAVLSDREIKAAREAGEIFLEPYHDELVQGSSVDLRLGEEFFSCGNMSGKDYLNLYDEQAVRDYFRGPLRAERHDEWCDRHDRKLFRNIPADARLIVLRPRERILARTIEGAGILQRGTTKMQARSSLGRFGIVVCKDAGWGDPGYISPWTMEIQNDNEVHVPLVIGTPVSQIVFFRTGEVDKLYRGSYQETTATDPADWPALNMLPNPLKVFRPSSRNGSDRAQA